MIPSLTKFELTRLYYPNCDKNKVTYFFRTEIHSNSLLLAELKALGYTLYRKSLSTPMVKVIFKHLTDPRVE